MTLGSEQSVTARTRNAYRSWVRVHSLTLAEMWVRTVGRTAPWMDPCETPHPTVKVAGVHLDVRIAPLIQGLWDLGIDTVNSCEGDARITRALAEVMPNLSGTPMVASITVTSTDDATTLHAALARSTRTRRPHVLPLVTWVDARYIHVQFDPADLAYDDFTARVLADVRESRGADVTYPGYKNGTGRPKS